MFLSTAPSKYLIFYISNFFSVNHLVWTERDRKTEKRRTKIDLHSSNYQVALSNPVLRQGILMLSSTVNITMEEFFQQ